MTRETELPLNQGQEAAAEGFFKFLFDEGTELIISGPGGVGKTFLMGHLIDEIMPRYEETCQLMGIDPIYTNVQMTATTNKAAEVLGIATGRPTQTIHSFLNLKVRDDFQTGKSILTKTNNWCIHKNTIIFIDESSMIDRDLLMHIRDATHLCKIVYVGDHCQLAPIQEPISPVYKQRIPFFELVEPMRTKNAALQAINDQLRETVKGNGFKPIRIVPGTIDLFDDDQMQDILPKVFLDPENNSRILAYTNAKVVQYNSYIRELRQFTDPYVLGERLINNSAVQFKHAMLSVEEEVEIVHLAGSSTMEMIDEKENVELEILRADLKTSLGEIFRDAMLPVDRDHFDKLIKYYKSRKDWHHYFMLKNKFPDLRPRDAATVHKAQGSTYDWVFIDLYNLSTCHNPNQAARLLYVAFTRAKNRVILYGSLADKYGGLITE